MSNAAVVALWNKKADNFKIGETRGFYLLTEKLSDLSVSGLMQYRVRCVLCDEDRVLTVRAILDSCEKSRKGCTACSQRPIKNLKSLLGKRYDNWVVVGIDREAHFPVRVQSQCEHKTEKMVAVAYLNKLGTCRKCYDINNGKFGVPVEMQFVDGEELNDEWKVISYSHTKKNSSNKHDRYWIIQHKCGDCITVPTRYIKGEILRGLKGCSNCYHISRRKVGSKYWQDVTERCRKLRKELLISQEDALKILENQDYRCVLTGDKLTLLESYNNGGNASLDRIVSSEPYRAGNVQWVTKEVNAAKLDYTTDYFIYLCSLVANRANPSVPVIASKFIEQSELEKNRKSYVWNRVRWNASSRNIPVNVTGDEAVKVMETQNYCCALSGLPLNLTVSKKGKLYSYGGVASFDRKDSSGIYELGNVWWVHKHINVSKWELPIADFIELCTKVALHNQPIVI